LLGIIPVGGADIGPARRDRAGGCVRCRRRGPGDGAGAPRL